MILYGGSTYTAAEAAPLAACDEWLVGLCTAQPVQTPLLYVCVSCR